jgi:hypothetical protein
MMTTSNQVRVTDVKPHAYKTNRNQAELRQTVTKEYASFANGNDMQSAFAPKEAFNQSGSTYQSIRVCWVDVPKDWDLKKATAHMEMVSKNKAFSPCIYQVLSFSPVLTSDDKKFMSTLPQKDNEAFLETKKNNQMMLNPKTGELVTRAGRPVFRKLFYSDIHKDDIDLTKEHNAAISMVTAETSQKPVTAKVIEF